MIYDLFSLLILNSTLLILLLILERGIYNEKETQKALR